MLFDLTGKIINLLIRLQQQFNLSYLFITHDLSLMRNVASRVVIMYLGKICEIAETVEFFRNPLHPYTQMLLSSIPVVSEAEEQFKPKKIISVGEIPSPVNIPRVGFNGAHGDDVAPSLTVMVETARSTVRCHLFPQR
jgi:peptide/nickel transport system ATP-binding protein